MGGLTLGFATHVLQQSKNNKMPSETADCASGAATFCRSRENKKVVFDSGHFAPLCEKITSSEKPELNNTLHYCQWRTEPPPQVTCTKNLVKVERVVCEICERTDRQTHRLVDTQTR